MTKCGFCGGDTASSRASYCSQACRQRAYRKRARDTAVPPEPVRPVWEPLDAFVGRQEESGELRALVRAHRLVTVTGPAGVGKTRLAGEVLFRGDRSARLVELASVHDARRLAEVFASALSLKETTQSTVDTLVERVRAAGALVLVVDNCEHLLAGCAALVDRLLAHCPRLRVVATSREPLGLDGEQAVRLDPLEVPTSDIPDVPRDQLQALDAVRLFVVRAREVAPGFTPGEDELRVVARICHRLDGIPLAIELAARQAHALSVHEIHELLGDRLRLLTQDMRGVPLRHLNLRTTIEWSYRLLSPAEQQALRRLAVCPGRFDIDLATSVCRGGEVGPEAVPALVRALAAKSLIQRLPDPRWYRLLHPVRWYAWERLTAAFEVEWTKSRVVDWAVGITTPLAEQVLPGTELTELLDAHRDTLEVAVTHLERHGGRAADRVVLTVALARAWRLRGRREAALRLLENMLDEVSPELHHPAALVLHAALLNQRGDHLAALRVAMAAVARADSSPGIRARALRTVAGVLYELDHAVLFDYYYERAIAETSAFGRPLDAAICQNFLAWSLLPDGFIRARELVDSGMPVFRRDGTPDEVALALHTSAAVSFVAGDVEAAHRDLSAALPESLRLASRHQRYLWPFLLEGFAVLAWHEGEAGRAATLFAAAQPLREDSQPRLTRVWHELMRHVRASAEAALSPRALLSARRRADAMSDAELLMCLRGESAQEPAGVLTEQEYRVVELLAEGNTSAQIARRLPASVRTVAHHLGRIRAKLALDSRGQIVRWYLRQQA
ncbi:hypothetical protein Lesp02_08300 [Lentzea sp. NBRC 105346]|uniref:ATP-binding protein n=1 Tax=Lentzea sp. NBRC 105346 TaxID=3032205 RepID=UPI0024A554BF|nr:LuxR C-terminal-related transcriptional regulator [Lentzea sp. NBRC 105346]GLZ28640.1 hypothetical protein Lesp02_08300 [Lentzea sp. NBRC 105346]